MDLSFIDENNYEWFVSVSHEKMSWLNICDEEKQHILDYIPNLQLRENESKTLEQLLKDKETKFLSLKDEICNLGNLWVLFVAFNNMEKIPKDIGKLTNLWYMGIHNNKIKELPESIRDIVELKYISIFNNDFKDINYEISKFKNIECVRVDAEF
jgi:internalin A